MSNRFDRIVCAYSRLLQTHIWLAVLFWAAGSSSVPAAPPPAAPPYVARARLIAVEKIEPPPPQAPPAGAGVRTFRSRHAPAHATPRFVIRWQAEPPGIPPGAVVLLEYVQARQPAIRSLALRTSEKSLGRIRSHIEIPAAEIRRAGPVEKWRVRLVWRGRILDTRASRNWDG